MNSAFRSGWHRLLELIISSRQSILFCLSGRWECKRVSVLTKHVAFEVYLVTCGFGDGCHQ